MLSAATGLAVISAAHWRDCGEGSLGYLPEIQTPEFVNSIWGGLKNDD
jgi:hypothetical protein